jgi:integrase
MKGKITKRSIDALMAEAKTAGGAVFLWDSELAGFGAKAASSACSYVVQYRLGGRDAPTKRMTIGKHGVLTPDEARKRAKEELGKVARGADIALDKRAAREKLTGTTLKNAIERFLAANKRTGRYWVHKKARLLGKDMEPLHGRPLASIKRYEVLAVIDRVKMRSEAAARLLFVDLRPFFKWAVERELIEANPTLGMKPPAAATKRDRVLEDYEVKAFWQAASETSWPFASIYKILLLTGARREEVAGMRWSELDLDAGVWLLPGERTKNKRDHRIPLSPQAIDILDRRGIAAIKAGLGYQDSDFVFSTTGHSGPSGFSKAKRTLDERMKSILGTRFKDWRVHDLRRTCATGMENLGIDTRVVETALNHVSGTKAGIVGVYQLADHRDAVAAAFRAWDRHVIGLIDCLPTNVVPFRVA